MQALALAVFAACDPDERGAVPGSLAALAIHCMAHEVPPHSVAEYLVKANHTYNPNNPLVVVEEAADACNARMLNTGRGYKTKSRFVISTTKTTLCLFSKHEPSPHPPLWF